MLGPFVRSGVRSVVEPTSASKCVRDSTARGVEASRSKVCSMAARAIGSGASQTVLSCPSRSAPTTSPRSGRGRCEGRGDPGPTVDVFSRRRHALRRPGPQRPKKVAPSPSGRRQNGRRRSATSVCGDGPRPGDGAWSIAPHRSPPPPAAPRPPPRRRAPPVAARGAGDLIAAPAPVTVDHGPPP